MWDCLILEASLAPGYWGASRSCGQVLWEGLRTCGAGWEAGEGDIPAAVGYLGSGRGGCLSS